MDNMEQTRQLIVDILNEHRKAELDEVVNDYVYGKISLESLFHKANIISNNYEYRIEAVRNKYFYRKTEK